MTYLIRFHGLVIASQLLAARPPAVLQMLRDPQMALFDLPFAGSLQGTAVDLLRGMLAK